MFLLITFIDIVYNVDCKRVIYGVCFRENEPKVRLFFTDI